MILTSETLAIKLVYWVAPEWFLKASLEHPKNFRNFLFEMASVQLAILHFLEMYCIYFLDLTEFLGFVGPAGFGFKSLFGLELMFSGSGLLEVLAGPFTTT